VGKACSTHGGIKIHTKCSPENLKGTDHFGYLDIDGRIILKLILKKQDV
jgi:hypothetical protein